MAGDGVVLIIEQDGISKTKRLDAGRDLSDLSFECVLALRGLGLRSSTCLVNDGQFGNSLN